MTWLAVLIRVLGLILEALTENRITTKRYFFRETSTCLGSFGTKLPRDIYYKDVKLFRKQSVVDTIIDDIAYTFGVERGKLNVVAAAKGLVCGHLKIWFKSGDAVECWSNREVTLCYALRNLSKLIAYCDQGILIPSARLIDRIDILDVEWVLVIEKEVQSCDIVPQ